MRSKSHRLISGFSPTYLRLIAAFPPPFLLLILPAIGPIVGEYREIADTG